MLKQTLFVIFLIMSISLVMSPLESAFAIVTSGVVTGGTALTVEGGVFEKLTPPIGPVGDDNHQSPNLFAFDETQNVVIPAGGVTTDQCFNDVGTCPIPAGTIVASHYVFFDPLASRTQEGTVDFDSDVYAIITSTANLLASDFLITTNADYQNPGARGIEGADVVSRSGPQQIAVDWAASSPGDYIRVLTVFSPGGEEVCDGMDNDGDGEIDEIFPNLGDTCTAGIGVCEDQGTIVCSQDKLSTECDGVPGPPETEVCDDLDNDCDGMIDEEFPEENELCFAGEGICQNSGNFICDIGNLECTAEAGEVGSDEICDEMDNDCDGMIDEDFEGVGDNCIVGVGVCENQGTVVCSDDKLAVECNAIPGSPEVEVCDALDNDCDGIADDDLICKIPDVPRTVGGKTIPIETSSLILAGAQSFSWMIPLVLSALGIGLFVIRKSENS